jgi:hypothetical protein
MAGTLITAGASGMSEMTVVSVSWRSSDFLRDLFQNLLLLADRPETIRLLVGDNTKGTDPDLRALDFPALTLVPVDVEDERMSMAHAIGLNTLVPHVETPYTLIIDPDVAVLQSGWDTRLYSTLAGTDIVAIGAPYPGWKLGKYHDFPSPPFAFWKTDALKSLNPDWRPYGRTTARRLFDFILRQTFWIPRVIDRKILRLPHRRFRVGVWTERVVGVVSKDTGWEVAHRARQRGWRARLFTVVFGPDDLYAVSSEQRAGYLPLAQEFELYAWDGKPFMTHRNPTLTQFGFNLWTDNNVTLYQNQADKIAKTARWRELIEMVGSQKVIE